MADRALLTGYPRYMLQDSLCGKCYHFGYSKMLTWNSNTMDRARNVANAGLEIFLISSTDVYYFTAPMGALYEAFANCVRVWICRTHAHEHSVSYFLKWCTLENLIRCGRVTHKCVSKQSIIGSDNGMSPGRRQSIIWNNDAILSIRPIGTNFDEIVIESHTLSFKKSIWKCRLEMASILSRPQNIK